MSETPETPKDQLVFVVNQGSVEYLHTDSVPLHRHGKAEARRASDVEFDEAKQKWVAVEAGTGRIIAEDESREACIAAERRYFNEKLAQGHEPFSGGKPGFWSRLRARFGGRDR